ncbi:MAG: AMP-binding protein [bacterium]|nr:AMP-binding protein [bacterium]MDE0288782.1 AMP-binding protein [bacterium]MDE0438664.1 AMP-binding protein [bacterium]
MSFADILRKAGTFYAARTAVVYGDRRLTYAELYERSCRLANALADHGVRPGDRVATLADNLLTSCEEMAGLALGGFVRSPMYTQNPVGVHLYMLDVVGARALIVQDRYWKELAPHIHEAPTVRTVLVHGDGQSRTPEYDRSIEQASSKDRYVAVSPDDPHIIRFSAGTTGRPKGICHTAAGWLAMGNEHSLGFPPLQAQDRQLIAGPMSHASGFLVWPMIAGGACHVIMPRFDPARFLELVESQRCTRALLIPTMIRMIVDHPDIASRDLSSLVAIYYGAAPIAEKTLQDARAVWGNIMYQVYAQSECLPISVLSPAYHRPEGTDRERAWLRSAGRPFPNVCVRIVDDDGEELAVGEMGEIVALSPGGMKEIWDDPEATSKRFTADGWVRTRDIGYLDDDGFVYVADRKEDMIISGGFNIWPAEIENALYSHPAIQEACVVGVPHPKWGETPKAVVVLKGRATATESELIDWCRDRVGSAKKPTSVEFSDEPLPKSPVGKMVRRAVRDRYWKSHRHAVHGA